MLACLILSSDRPAPMHPSALAEIATVIQTKVFRLRTDLHTPDFSGESMIVPTLEGRGWHHHNPNGAITLRSGSQVEVTGIFNYGDRGIVLELAREDVRPARESITIRPRARIRIMVATSGTDPEGQKTEAFSLIAKVLDFTAP